MRLIAPPALLLLLIMIVGDITHLEETFTTIYVVIVFLLGSSDAGSAFPKEIKNKTWDFQRTSQLSPLRLVVGKLLGAPLYSWYMGLCVLFCTYLSMGADPNMKQQYTLLMMICAGLLGHVFAFLYSVMAAGSGTIVGIIVSLSVWGILGEYSTDSTVTWLFYDLNLLTFMCASTLFWGVWAFRASVCLLRERMQYKNMPWDWVLFLGTSCVYFIGIWSDEIPADKWWYYASLFTIVISLVTAYLMLLLEAYDMSRYKRFWNKVKTSSWNGAWEIIPRWGVSMGFAFVALAVFLIGKGVTGDKGVRDIYFCIGLVLFVCRDGLVFHAALLGQRVKHSIFWLVIFYVLMYVMLPSFSGVEWFSHVKRSMAEGAASVPSMKFLTWFYPPVHGKSPTVLLPVLIECGLCAYLLLWRIRRLKTAS